MKYLIIMLLVLIAFSIWIQVDNRRKDCCYVVVLNSNQGVFTYWKEIKPTTDHGICAALYSNKEQNMWEVDHPIGVNNSGGSANTITKFFPTVHESVKYAESICPSNGVIINKYEDN